MLSRLRSLLRNLIHRDRMQRDLEDEMRAMFDLLVDEKIAEGMQPWEARRAASIELGGVEPLKERVRDVKMGVWLESVLKDCTHAFRQFRRAPGFAVSAVLILALGIGANTAIFSVLNALNWQRLSIASPDTLYSLSSYNERGQKRYVPMPTVLELNREGPFVEACGYNGGGVVPVEANRIPTQGIVAFVTGRCFSVFGVGPVLGRGITDDDAPVMTSGARVVVISDRLWNRLFNRSPEVLGQLIRIDNSEATIVGVLPPGFRGIHADSGIDIFAPPDSVMPATSGRRPVAQEVLGRLKPGLTLRQAQAEMDARWPALLETAKAMNQGATEGQSILGPIVRVDPMGRGLSASRDQFARPVTIILGLTTVLLVLACVNLGGLLLTRLNTRSSELGVRLALGGSQFRIAQQMLVESLLLSGAGTLLAIPAAFAFVMPLPALINPGWVGWDRSFAPNGQVLAVTAAVGFTAGVMLTLAPTWFALRRQGSVRFTWDRTTVGTATRWTRGLVVVQVALSVMLVVGAGLLTRSLYAAQATNPGVRTAQIMAARLEPSPGGRRGLNPRAHYPALFEEIRAIPGVTDLAYSSVFPYRITVIGSDVGFAGEDFTGVRTSLDSVSPNFFELMGIRLIAGRTFTESDQLNPERVVVLSEGLARQLSPDLDVVGRRLRFQTQRDMQNLQVVGVVANSTQGDIRRPDVNVMFSPAMHAPTFYFPNLVLEVAGDSGAVADALRRVVLDHGREYVGDVGMLADVLARGPAQERLNALLSAMIGVIAILLAAIGIHGVLAYSVARRQREIGLRLAVGAAPSTVARTIVRESLIMTGIGLAIGLPAAYLAARALRPILFGVTATDALSFAAAAVVFALLGTVAGVAPARRAARIDPAIALRAE